MRTVLMTLALCAACDPQRLAEVVDADLPDASCPDPGNRLPTWSYLYASYFGPDTPGHCGNVGCHDTLAENHGGWACGATAHACYTGMLARVVNGSPRPLLDPADPPASLLVDPAKSPLVWFNPLGNMPFDAPTPNPCAGRDVPLWLAPDGGAPEN